MPTAQFDNQQARISKRLDNFNKISRLLSSSKKTERQQAQRLLKALGRYNGPIDGNQGKGTTSALKAMRKKIDTDQTRLDNRVNSFNANAAQKRKDKAQANARKDKNALIQSGAQAVSLVTSSTVVAVQVNKLNKLDKPAVAARNKELARFTKEIDKIKAEPGARTKAKTLKAATKQRIGAIAKQAKKAGVTRYKGPTGAPSGGLLFAKGAMLKYAATKVDNEIAKGVLDATGNGLMLAGAGVPAYRFTRNAFGINQLNGQHLAKIADAETIAATTTARAKPKSRAPAKKSIRSTTLKGVKAVGKKAAKAVPIVGWAATAYFAGEAAYNTFSKTGSAAKAATAAGDEITFGVVSGVKKELSLSKAQKNKLRVSNARRLKKSRESSSSLLRRVVRDAKANKVKSVKVRSVKGELAKSSLKVAVPKKVRAVSVKRKVQPAKRAGATFKRTRVVNGKRIHETVRNHRYKR